MITKIKIALVLLTLTAMSFSGLSFLDATPTQQVALAPGRDVLWSYVDDNGNEHETIIVAGGWGYVDMIIYKGFELVPIEDGEKWHVKIFSSGKRVMTTMLLAGEELAVTEAKNMVDESRPGTNQ